MTQDQWMKEAERLIDAFEGAVIAATTPQYTDEAAREYRKLLLAHLQQRPLPVREGADDRDAYHAELDEVVEAIGYPPHKNCMESPAEYAAELKRDALRYRWLRHQDWFEGDLCVLRDPKKALTSGRGLGADCPSRERLDSAIDAALASSPSVQNMGEGETSKDGVKACPDCGATEPFTGSCGGGSERALCRRAGVNPSHGSSDA